MIVSDDTIYGKSEEIEALQEACVDFGEAAGISLEHVVGAIMHIVEIEAGRISDILQDEALAKSLPKRFRCRVCGRHYDFKGEAKACEREHKQWRR